MPVVYGPLQAAPAERLSPKDPDDSLTYAVDWKPFLARLGAAVTVSSASWTVPAGISQESSSTTSTQTLITLSGGTANQTYKITCRMTPSTGNAASRSFLVKVAER